jgi:phosphonoacetaldehyde hydrolase
MKRIECIIMDWAGSAVDYGCFAPVAAFLKAFNEIGINITMEQARRYPFLPAYTKLLSEEF